jgi:D-serine deaminase-like pyridoxal phosphate-dependent protein
MLTSLIRPSLLIDEAKCRINIRRMADKASASGVIFRPHFKTHQSPEVAGWFRDIGIDKITVSSVGMALQFADGGWNDITVAFPVNLRELSLCNILAEKIKLNLLVDSLKAARAISEKIHHRCSVFIEVDCGYGRSGIHYENIENIRLIVRELSASSMLEFKGFLSHFGNTYHAESKAEIEYIYHNSVQHLKQLKERFIQNHPGIIISIGDTPSCSLVEDLSDADEIRPGNFVFYDLMQNMLGASSFADIAVSVACPVCGIYPERNEILIYGGAVHLSKEYLEEDGKFYGLVVMYTEEGWSPPLPDARLVSISQEHGIIKANSQLLASLKLGDMIGILPVHSCLTANLLKENTIVISRQGFI